MAEQIKRQRFGVRRHVKRLGIAHARQRARRHVPNRIPARLARRDPHRRQPAKHIRRVLDADEMQLDVLPGRDMADGIGIFLRQFRQHDHLLRIHTAIRNLDPLHPRASQNVSGPLVSELYGNFCVLNPS